MNRKILGCWAATLLLITPPAHAADDQPCVSRGEFFNTATGPTKYHLEMHWEVRGQGFPEPMPMGLFGPGVRWKAYPLCGATVDQGWVSIVYRRDNRKSRATVLTEILVPGEVERHARP